MLALEKGDPAASPPVAADARALAARMKLVEHALRWLALSSVMLFDYAAAAIAFESMSGRARLHIRDRTDAARNAALLFAALGEATRFAAARARPR